MSEATSIETSIETALLGWAAIMAVVIGYDAWALTTGNQTLSKAFWRTSENPAGRVVLAATWGGLTWHLMLGDRQVLPDRYHQLYEKLHPFYIGRSWLIRNR